MKKQLALLLLLPMGIVAQVRTLNKADKKFDSEAYVSAIQIYERIANKGMGSEQIYEKLGDANYFNANYVQAEQWYTKRYELKGTFPKEFLYRYAQSLKSAGKTDQAKQIMVQYAKENPTQLRTKNQLQTKAQESIKKGSDVFTITNLNTNSKYSDYSSSIKGDTLLFASARPKAVGNQIYARTGQSYTNLYYAVKRADGSYSKTALYSKSTFSIFHEASPVFTQDGKTMYYTQNELKENNQKRVVDGGRYKIYKSVFKNGKWNNLGVQDIFAQDAARVAHPALSPDGKTLYFASDARGSFGQSDLFKVTINEDGSYTAPENLGTNINTEGRESYPFITKDNILLFASDGHQGMGGFDIFAVDLNQKDALPVHLTSPINSPFDDFGIYWNRNTNQGVFTSNRPGGQGDDDLYEFTNNALQPFAFEYNTRIFGKLTDKNTNHPLVGTVVLFDNFGREINRYQTNESGTFVFEKVNPNQTYRLQANAATYTPNETTASVAIYDKEAEANIALDQDSYKIQQGLDLAKALSLRHIYFDLDKSNIRKDARVELEKIVEVLNQFPSLKIEIGSHTDSRQSKSYNQALSQRRAKSTLDYLVQRGINKNRLTAKGYGETQLINQCADGVKCSEAEHQLNRRSTFVIINQ
ncbi:OmpA family protein [Flavobacterium ammonificans]|uniref:OmpA family protein n=1 Tax=Flavobacterium ammonificans TaxID=1751056 RepID=UPI001E2DDB24|nr:OmpA family protein [Flavobacterium ammonificans]BDB56382.1 cell envelope biogenesis protein OmpA [Flavobacterium ammonificans]